MIGIITFHSQYNCGSALQVYALQEAVKSLRHECKILNYYYETDMKNYDVRWFTKNPKVILFDLYTLRNCLGRKKSYKLFQNKFLNLSEMTAEWEELRGSKWIREPFYWNNSIYYHICVSNILCKKEHL